MHTYLAMPNDTLFFRGGEPMGMGESHFQTSIFPPSPETFIGAIRTLIIARMSDNDFEGYKSGKYRDTAWCREIGFNTFPESFTFVGPFLRKDNKLLYTPPSNLYISSDKKRFAITSPKYFDDVIHSSGVKSIMWIDRHSYVDSPDWKPIEDYITMEGMEKYLKGSIDLLNYEEDFMPGFELFKNEQRTGIALERGLRTARTGHLYMTSHKRFIDDTGIIFMLEGVSSFPDSDILQLGGENRTVSYVKISELKMLSFVQGVEFLVTTMPFKVHKVINGVPVTEFLDDDFIILLPGGVKSKLISYSLNKPLLFGGWDMVKGKSKEMGQYVPAGSVFYFEKCNVKGKNNKFLLGGKNVQ